jgi:predicted NBD/HSP70 family sugar kinase
VRGRHLILAVAAVLGPAIVLAAGGLAQDRLDWPGSPTDRYLDSEEVRTTLHSATDGFFQCFRTHARSGVDASDSGVTFTVQRDGAATGIVAEVGSAPEALAACLADVVAALDFGEHDGDPLEVSYPVVYQVDRRGARVLPYPVVFSRPVPVRLPLLQLPPDIGPGEVRMLELILVEDAPPAAAP